MHMHYNNIVLRFNIVAFFVGTEIDRFSYNKILAIVLQIQTVLADFSRRVDPLCLSCIRQLYL